MLVDNAPRLFETELEPLVPLYMADVRAADGSNGLNVVSTFSGAGGSCLGFRLSGFDVIYALEFVEAARECYLANFPAANIDPRDVRDVTGDDLLGAAKRAGYDEVHVLEGSPPCSAFSTGGMRDRGWGTSKAYSDTEQRVDDLFFEWTRLVKDVQPLACVAENVPGLALGKAVPYLEQIVAELRDAGYLVAVHDLNAADYGVPQARHRLFFQGIRKDLGILPNWPRRTAGTYRTVEQVLDWVRCNGGNDADELAFASMDPERFAIGREWPNLREGEISSKYFNMTRAHRDNPSPTVTAVTATPGSASVTHPYECRKFTVKELRLISSFPLDFELTGSFQKQIERIGRAVPPLLAAAVSGAIRDALLPVVSTKKKESLW